MKRTLIFCISLFLLILLTIEQNDMLHVSKISEWVLAVTQLFVNSIILPLLIASDAKTRGFTRTEYVMLVIASVPFGFIVGIFYSLFSTFGQKFYSLFGSPSYEIEKTGSPLIVKERSVVTTTFRNIILFITSLPAFIIILATIWNLFGINSGIVAGALYLVALAMAFMFPFWAVPVLIVLVITLVSTYKEIKDDNLPLYAIFRKSKLISLYAATVGIVIVSSLLLNFINDRHVRQAKLNWKEVDKVFPSPDCNLESESECRSIRHQNDVDRMKYYKQKFEQ